MDARPVQADDSQHGTAAARQEIERRPRQFLVQITCKCGAQRLAEPEALARLCGSSATLEAVVGVQPLRPPWEFGIAAIVRRGKNYSGDFRMNALRRNCLHGGVVATALLTTLLTVPIYAADTTGEQFVYDWTETSGSHVGLTGMAAFAEFALR